MPVSICQVIPRTLLCRVPAAASCRALRAPHRASRWSASGGSRTPRSTIADAQRAEHEDLGTARRRGRSAVALLDVRARQHRSRAAALERQRHRARSSVAVRVRLDDGDDARKRWGV